MILISTRTSSKRPFWIVSLGMHTRQKTMFYILIKEFSQWNANLIIGLVWLQYRLLWAPILLSLMGSPVNIFWTFACRSCVCVLCVVSFNESHSLTRHLQTPFLNGIERIDLVSRNSCLPFNAHSIRRRRQQLISPLVRTAEQISTVWLFIWKWWSLWLRTLNCTHRQLQGELNISGDP